MVFKTDVTTYKVVYKNNENVLVVEKFKSFASAAGFAGGLLNTVRFLDVEFSNKDKTSSISGSLYVYSKNQSERRACNQYLINQVSKRGGL